METSTTALHDRAEIADLVARLAHAQDDKDWDAFAKLFAARVRLDLSGQSGEPAELLTADQLTAKAQEVLGGFACTHHVASDLLIAVSDDTATCRAHMVAYHQVPTTGVDHCVMRGRWELGLTREPGSWTIDRWTIVRTAPWEGDPDVYRIAAANRRSGS